MQTSTHLAVASSLRAVSLGAKAPRRRRPPPMPRIGPGGAFRPPRPARTNLWRLDRPDRCGAHRHGRARRPFQAIPGQPARLDCCPPAGPIGWTRSHRLAGRDAASAVPRSPAPEQSEIGTASGIPGRRHGARRPTVMRTAVRARIGQRRAGGVRRMLRTAARPVRPALPAAWGHRAGRTGLPDRRAAGAPFAGPRSAGGRARRGDRRAQPPGMCGAGRWRAASSGERQGCAPGASKGELRAPSPWHAHDE